MALGIEVPEGFTADTLVEHIQAATAMTFAPDGRLFFAEQTGALRLWKEGRLLSTPALDLAERVDDYWERGFIGLTLHPDFPRTPHLFVVYVAKVPYTHHVASRFTMAGDFVDPKSERILLEGDDQSTLGGSVPAGHQGGPIKFGPDGKLYIAFGEQTAGEPSQSLHTFQGKILRINPDGSIPKDNPFYAKTTGKYRAIWALGMRNPFGLVFQPGTGRLFATDVGGSAFEEIDEIVKGGNYGWPHAEGYSDNPEFKSPLYAYPPTVGHSICGGAFYPESIPEGAGDIFPEKWRGKLLFVDWGANWLKALDPDAPEEVLTLARGLDKPVGVEVAPDGSVFILNRGTIWRDGRKFEANSGSLVRIRYTGERTQPLVVAGQAAIPVTLSGTGLFTSLNPLKPDERFTRFEINLPPRRPGVRAKRWISLPTGEAIRIREDGTWAFPKGAVVVQHYLLDGSYGTKAPRPFETHVFWMTGAQTARAAAYRWNDRRDEAMLVEDPMLAPLPGRKARQWFSPGVEKHLDLDTLIIGFLLPINTQQLNREIKDPESGKRVNQLAHWNAKGWFDPPFTTSDIENLPRLVPLSDQHASLEDRVRSYLDVNCAKCHHPGGLSRGDFDARITTPLARQNLINGKVLTENLGIEDARIVKPGDPEKSILYQRLNRSDFLRMPPVALNDEPEPVLPLVKEWILQLAETQAAASQR